MIIVWWTHWATPTTTIHERLTSTFVPSPMKRYLTAIGTWATIVKYRFREKNDAQVKLSLLGLDTNPGAWLSSRSSAMSRLLRHFGQNLSTSRGNVRIYSWMIRADKISTLLRVRGKIRCSALIDMTTIIQSTCLKWRYGQNIYIIWFACLSSYVSRFGFPQLRIWREISTYRDS